MSIVLEQDLWRQDVSSDVRIAILRKGSKIFRCIPRSYFKGPINYRKLLLDSFIRDTKGSLAFIISLFGSGKRAYFSDSLDNTLKEVYMKDDAYVIFECEILMDVHVIEAVPNSVLLQRIHDNMFVSSLELAQFKVDLQHIKQITDDNSYVCQTTVGYRVGNDHICGFVFNSNKNFECKTVVMLNSDTIKVTQILNSVGECITEDKFNEVLCVNPDCSFTYNYSDINLKL